ncbi:hypothetical protein NC651_003910 [Populus alba x Populus x berolinensis]|nr:hypothetical protein NC651_003910 [Populus alba x Populus x berolinensis]
MSSQPHEEERFLYPIYTFLSVLLLQLSLGAFLIFSETSIIPRTILG